MENYYHFYINVKGGSKIPVQVVSIQRHKTYSKENDPNMMPARKKKKRFKNISQFIKIYK